MKAEKFILLLKENGIQNFIGVPCSVFKEVINYLEKNENYIPATSEGEAMGIAAGVALSKNIPAIIMQNDGFGNAINPLSSLNKLYELPALLIISWRGEPGKKDAPQHKWMGKTIIDLLRLFQIDYLILNSKLDTHKDHIASLISKVKNEKKICALICKKGIFEKDKTQGSTIHNDLLSREEAIQIVLKEIENDTPIISTTGKISREIYKNKDRENNFYMVGSMGCASSIAFGFYQNKQEKIVVLDGDGAVLMKMGTLATIGAFQPEKFLHICLDNETYESTGGQTTVASKIELSKIARAANYKVVETINNKEGINRFIQQWNLNPRLSFLHIKVKNETDKKLGRPKETPIDLRDRFWRSLND